MISKPSAGRCTTFFAAFCFACCGTAASADSTKTPDKFLLLIGVAHFSNPGLDVANTKVDDMLAPNRQVQLAALAKRLASFHPNHVAVEWPHAKQDKLDERYKAYREGRYTLTANEVDQLGLRVAAMLDLPRVDAADWNDNAPGQDADYDYERYAADHGRQAELDVLKDGWQHQADIESMTLARSDIGDWLAVLNDPQALAKDNRGYFELARFSDDTQQPGANWVGTWYGRNLKILNNLRAVADQPGDRVLAIFGAGHSFLISEFAEQSGAFKVIPPKSYLKAGR